MAKLVTANMPVDAGGIHPGGYLSSAQRVTPEAGRTRETLLIRDGRRNSALYSILEQEWAADRL